MRARQSVVVSLCCSILAISAACSDAANPVLSLDGPVALQPVTSVVVTPSQATLPIGSRLSMKITTGKANGQPVTGAVTWTSSDTTVATVSAVGEVVARAAGEAVIMASVGAAHAVAAVDVPTADVPASDSAGPEASPSDTAATSASSIPDSAASTPDIWTDEPSGMHVINDNPWNSLTPKGWTMRGGGAGKLAIGSDASAPASPSSVLQFKYPAGFSGSGSAPGSEYFTGFDGSKEIFVAFDWKVSADWQQHTAGFSKLIYLVHCSYCNTTSQPGGRIAYVMMMQGRIGGPYHLMMNDEIYNTNKIQPNVGDGTVVPGRWYRVEISVKGQSTSGANDGWIKFWIDGRPVAQYLNLPIPSRGFTQLTIDPVWGGVDPNISKTHTDYMWFDHIHVSAR